MTTVRVKAYPSPTMVLLGLDWADGAGREDFLGFAIARTPGFNNEPQSWLPNRIDFNGPAPQGTDYPSDQAPVQKFMWWDARFDDSDRGAAFTYEVAPVTGRPGELHLLRSAAARLRVRIPQRVEEGIGTYFNRAVVSSQSFTARFGRRPTGTTLQRALSWLANGLERAIPAFLTDSPEFEGAIYHLDDEEWVIPALLSFHGDGSLVYNHKKDPPPADKKTEGAVARLEDALTFHPRSRTNLMHDKFLVRLVDGEPRALLMGSANFTTSGLATQANLLHTFDSPELAALYLERARLLADDPTKGKTAAEAGWSREVRAGDCRIRAFFAPEPRDHRASIDAVVAAVRKATSSVLFCIYTPTDKKLRDAMFEAGTEGKMMFGLVNQIGDEEPDAVPARADSVARVEIFHRSRDNRDVYAHSLFPQGNEPAGFWWESARLGTVDQARFPVYIHHKFVVIDGETDRPTIYTGSANMSKNSVENNDENLLEIKGSPRLAAIYLAEFLRLYEHYRARAQWQRWEENRPNTFKLRPDATWVKNAYKRGSPEYKSRVNMVK